MCKIHNYLFSIFLTFLHYRILKTPDFSSGRHPTNLFTQSFSPSSHLPIKHFVLTNAPKQITTSNKELRKKFFFSVPREFSETQFRVTRTVKNVPKSLSSLSTPSNHPPPFTAYPTYRFESRFRIN